MASLTVAGFAAILGAGAAVVGTVSSIQQGREAESARKKQQGLRRGEADLRNARARRRQVADQRRLRATAEAQAEGSGISGGSQIGGVVSSLGTQGATNASFSNSLQSLDQAQFNASSSFQSATAGANRAAVIGSTFSNLAFKFS